MQLPTQQNAAVATHLLYGAKLKAGKLAPLTITPERATSKLAQKQQPGAKRANWGVPKNLIALQRFLANHQTTSILLGLKQATRRKKYLTMTQKQITIRHRKPKYAEPTSSKFDPNFECWVISSKHGGYHGCMMPCIDELYEQTNVADYYSKSEVIDACLKFGYFGYGNFAICYLPQTNKSSLDLMEGE